MKRREHLMLKRAALASIQLEALPLARVGGPSRLALNSTP